MFHVEQNIAEHSVEGVIYTSGAYISVGKLLFCERGTPLVSVRFTLTLVYIVHIHIVHLTITLVYAVHFLRY